MSQPPLPPLNIDAINSRINNEVCWNTIQQLTDESLLNTYKNCDSVQHKLEQFRKTLEIYIDEHDKINNIIDKWTPELVPAGTKGVIRGNKFNHIVKDHITSLHLDYDIKFESQHPDYIMPEKPDWYIYNASNKKIIIGMNQIALWGGGQQDNRGSKYISKNNPYNNEHCKLLCVVCDHIQFKSNNKTSKLFHIGFEDDTLCYLNGLEEIIQAFLQ